MLNTDLVKYPDSLLNSISEYLDEGIIVCDSNGSIRELNTAAQKLTGYEHLETNLPVASLFHANDKWNFFDNPSKSKSLKINKVLCVRTNNYVSVKNVPIIYNDKKNGCYLILSDITEQVALEQKIKELRKEIHNTNSNQQGMTFKYKKCKNRFVLTMCEGGLMSRMSLTQEHVLNKEMSQIFSFRSLNKSAILNSYYQRAWDGEKRVCYESKLHGVTYKALLTPIKNKQGDTIEVIGSCIDISDRKRIEGSLNAAEQIQHHLMQNTLTGIFVFEDYKFSYGNPYFYNLFDYTEAEFKKLKLQDLIYEEDRPKFVEKVNQTLIVDDAYFFFSIRCRKKDGTITYIEGQLSKTIYQGKETLIGIIQDATYKKVAEDALHESMNRYYQLLQLLPEPIMVSHKGKIIYVNNAALNLMYIPDEYELFGNSAYNYIHADYHDIVKKNINKILETNLPTPLYEIKLVSPNKQLIDVEVSSVRIDNNNSDTPLILSVVRDLRERKLAKEMMLRTERLSVVGQLAAGVAHEIRNPLTALRGFTQLLRAECSDRYSYYLDIMLNELDRINYIVNEFMALSKPKLIQYQETNLHGVMNDVVSLLEPQAILVNAQLAVQADESLPLVNCDENQLKQVFVNIIKNAFEAMPKGGNIEIALKHVDSNLVQISIKDEGSGIPKETLQQIGQPFYTTKEGGNGLGIMVCQKIIHAHDGQFNIVSECGKGTTIIITLPIDRKDG